MITAAQIITVAGDALTLDLILWRLFRQPTPGLVERVLDMNQGLARLGVWLPVGTVLTVPAVDLEEMAKESDVVTLWE